MQSAEEFVKQQLSKNEPTFDEIDLGIRMIAARDAEWQARVDAFLEDNNRSEEQVKKQFANAVSFKARAEKAEARVDRLEAALNGLLRCWDLVCDTHDWDPNHLNEVLAARAAIEGER